MIYTQRWKENLLICFSTFENSLKQKELDVRNIHYVILCYNYPKVFVWVHTWQRSNVGVRKSAICIEIFRVVFFPSVSVSHRQALEGQQPLAEMRGKEQQSPQPHPVLSWLSAGQTRPPGYAHGCRNWYSLQTVLAQLRHKERMEN